jgi:paraquat-inducible protein A
LMFTRMYRVIAFIGRWSMLDIFMISILVGLVNMGGVANVIAGPAATAFAAVVVLTMFAAKSFDPRLLWDHQPDHE